MIDFVIRRSRGPDIVSCEWRRGHCATLLRQRMVHGTCEAVLELLLSHGDPQRHSKNDTLRLFGSNGRVSG